MVLTTDISSHQHRGGPWLHRFTFGLFSLLILARLGDFLFSWRNCQLIWKPFCISTWKPSVVDFVNVSQFPEFRSIIQLFNYRIAVFQRCLTWPCGYFRWGSAWSRMQFKKRNFWIRHKPGNSSIQSVYFRGRFNSILPTDHLNGNGKVSWHRLSLSSGLLTRDVTRRLPLP